VAPVTLLQRRSTPGIAHVNPPDGCPHRRGQALTSATACCRALSPNIPPSATSCFSSGISQRDATFSHSINELRSLRNSPHRASRQPNRSSACIDTTICLNVVRCGLAMTRSGRLAGQVDVIPQHHPLNHCFCQNIWLNLHFPQCDRAQRSSIRWARIGEPTEQYRSRCWVISLARALIAPWSLGDVNGARGGGIDRMMCC
jgi:hypothetical protein